MPNSNTPNKPREPRYYFIDTDSPHSRHFLALIKKPNHPHYFEVIELTPSVQKALARSEVFIQLYEIVDNVIDHSHCQAFSNEDYREVKELLKKAKALV